MNQDNVIFLASLVVLGLFAGIGAFRFLKRRRAHKWPTMRGRVDTTALKYVESGETSGAWVAAVSYQYTANGESHTGVHRRNFMTKGRGEKWLGAYATGAPLALRVNPKRPGDSVVLENDKV
ncbi:MAG TPA: DUF3592 domain-containing protein [Steroidobacteraceae bacterium]|jgi:hypothetical protein